MKSKLQFIEPLESRIAPALLVAGGNLLGGAGNPLTGETSTGGNTVTLVKVLSGQALVFFDGAHITAISIGKHTKLDITGDVLGDIVTNLGPDGRLTDSDNNPSNGEDGALLLPISIKGITTGPLGDQKGSIGHIVAGAQINNINVAGQLSGIYAGDGVFRNSDTYTVDTGIDFNTVNPGADRLFVFHKGAVAPNGNSSIKNVTVNTAAQLEIFSGSGQDTTDGVGIPGSDISNVTITKTLPAEGTKPALFIHTGDGGAGPDGGGKGGSITGLNDQGSSAYVKIQTGHGGDASNGAGGQGGFLQSSTIVSSATHYDFLMGDGGNGQTGGVGGGITGVNFTNTVTGGKSFVATRDLNGDGFGDVILVNTQTGETVVSLGHGGESTVRPGEANFTPVFQTVTQIDGSTARTPFLPAEGANPTSLKVADLNGDGLPDFVVSYASTDSLGIYLNQGAGVFTAARQDLTVSPTGIAIADFSGHGHADIAIVSGGNAATQQASLFTGVYLLANDGTGNFAFNPTATIQLGGSASAVANLGTSLYVGLKTGSIDSINFQNGVANLNTVFNVFGNGTPINDVDVVGGAGGSELLAFSKDINAAAAAAGNTTVKVTPQVNVYTLDSTGANKGFKSFNPVLGTTTAKFLADSSVVGTVSPGGLTFYQILSASAGYTVATSLSSTGALSNFDTSVVGGTYQIAGSGAATNQFFFTAGNPGGTDGVTPFLPVSTTNEPQVITFATGNGGNGDAFNGGTGGSVKSLTYSQTLGTGIAAAGGAYNTVVVTGHGGDSDGGTGGKGGGIRKASLSLTPTYLTYNDDTSSAIFLTGAGGDGPTGGDGGSIKKASVVSVFTEVIDNGLVDGSVAVRIQTGNGGLGTSAAGGNGGNIALDGQTALQGVSFVDQEAPDPTQPGLLVKTGNGGGGITAGGSGGSMTNIATQNAVFAGFNESSNQLASASLISGSGGDASSGNGGAGGTITGTNVTTSLASLPIYIDNKPVREASFEKDSLKDGSVMVTAGQGGVGHGGLGGNGGSINTSVLGSTISDLIRGYGLIVKGGAGGDGDAGGGAGGTLGKVIVNSPSTEGALLNNKPTPHDGYFYGAVLVAGAGGDALSVGVGGAGGDVLAVKQTKDVNSAINVIQAGDGGHGAGDIGGAGGSVTGVKSVGFVGLPSTNTSYEGAFFNIPDGVPANVSSLFASAQIPQGIFAGQGFDGAANGSVLNVVARQIAAIGATVQANGTFAAASTVDNVRTDLIGYDINQDGTFQSGTGQGVSPSQRAPIDGFILASVVSNVTTLDDGRTARFTFNG